MAEVDSLKINIEVDSSKAVSNLDSVTSAIKELNKAADDKSWKKFTNSVIRAGEASKGLGKLASAVRRLEGMQISPDLKKNLDAVAAAGEKLSAVGKGIHQFGYGLAKLSEVGRDSKKLEEVATSVGTFANKLSNAVSDETLARLERIAAAFRDIQAGAKGAASTMNGLEKANRQTAEQSKKNLAETVVLAKTLGSVFTSIHRGLSSMARDMFGILDASGITADIDAMGGAISKNIPVLGELTTAWRNEAKEIREILTSSENLVSKWANLMLVKVTHVITLLYSLAKMPFSKSSMGMTKAVTELVKLPVKKFANSITDITKRWNRFVSSLSRIAVYRLIRTALKEISQGVKEGIDNLYQWGLIWQSSLSSADRFVNTMNTLATAFLYLKNAVGAVVSPLLDYFAPAIDYLVDKMVSLLNVVNQAMAVLTGATTWRKAVKIPTEYGEAADKAGKKVKELQRTVLAFDELNRLEDNNKSGRGSGADIPDYSNMFTEETVSSRIKELVENSNWAEIGKILAQKINDGLSSIDWKSIQYTAHKIANRIGSLIGGFLSNLDWRLIGYSIAEAINTAVDSVNTIYRNINFVELGENLAKSFQTAMETVKWFDLGIFLTNKIKAAIDFLHGFKDVDLSGFGDGIVTMIGAAFENIDVPDLAHSIATMLPKLGKEFGKIINALVTNVNREMAGVDWGELGIGFGEAINNINSQLDPEQMGIFLTNGLKAFLETAHTLIKTLHWDELKESFGKLISSAFANIDIKTAVEDAVELAGHIVDFLNIAIENIPWKEIGDAFANADTTHLQEGLKTLFKNAIQGLKDSGALEEILKGLGIYSGLKIGGGLLSNAGNIYTMYRMKKMTDAVAAAGAGGAGTAAASSGGLLASLDAAVAAHPLLSAGGAAVIGGWLGGKLANNVFGPIMDFFGSDDAQYYSNFSWFGDGGFFDSAAWLIKDGFDGAAWWDSVVNGEGGGSHSIPMHEWLADAEAQVREFYGVLDEGATHTTGFVDNIRKQFSVFDEGEKHTKSFVDRLKGVVGYVENDFVPSWQNAWSGVSDFFGGVWDNVKTSLSSAADTLSTKLGGVFSGISNGISNLVANTPDIKPKSTIRRFASGGVITGGDLFIAGEAGPELVTSFGGESTVMNLDQISAVISQSVAMAGGGDITIPVILDGGILDRVIVTAQQRQSLRSGR